MPKKKLNPAEKIPHLAALQALHTCHLLKAAYDRGKENGGSVEWDDVDLAHKSALQALTMTKEL